MKKHTKIFFDYFKLNEADFVACEVCGRRATDIHHILFKSLGGKDNIENLIALCRRDHEFAHKHLLSKDYLQEIHKPKLLK